MQRILVINGPNLNLLGTRSPEIYGTTTLTDLEALCRSWGEELGIEVRAFQSNHEGALIDGLHEAREVFDGVVLNPGAYAHTSYAIHDAIEAAGIPTVEVHISNVEEREPWRSVSVTAPACTATIYGRGIQGYRWALRHLVFAHRVPPKIVAYGEGPDQVGDLRLPSGPGPHPIAVLVHGGFWRRQWTRDLMDGLATDLVERGFATWNLEYRRVGAGGGWPATVLDVARGIDHVALLDAAIDRDRVAVIGHSAGGHLALASSGRTDAVTPALLVSLAGITDLGAALRDGLGSGAVAAFMGDATSQTAIAQASPTAMLPLGVRQLVVHGTDDDDVPVDYSRRYVDSARAAGEEIEYLELASAGHTSLIDEQGAGWSDIAGRLAGMLP
ncbi:3-dehydroquinate dehydratase [bacterium BMS3Abin02]|nr:3-dehydroquinate dehydratase [bacterium BMS3Abin02]GBE21454.1 3-dehydroquinate dehydratase [bacterium BMS3Bbin01]